MRIPELEIEIKIKGCHGSYIGATRYARSRRVEIEVSRERIGQVFDPLDVDVGAPGGGHVIIRDGRGKTVSVPLIDDVCSDSQDLESHLIVRVDETSDAVRIGRHLIATTFIPGARRPERTGKHAGLKQLEKIGFAAWKVIIWQRGDVIQRHDAGCAAEYVVDVGGIRCWINPVAKRRSVGVTGEIQPKVFLNVGEVGGGERS